MNAIRSRADVQTDYHGNRGCPCLNVKIDLWENGNAGSFPDALLADVAAEMGEDPAAFVAWWRAAADAPADVPGQWNDQTRLGELIDGREGYGWRYLAAESAWEDAQSDADDCFPDHSPRVFSEGRSGGWLVVDGLPDVDSWDAVTLARWRRYAKWTAARVADFPRSVAWLICANVYQPEREEADRVAAARFERLRAGLSTLSGLAVAS